MSETLIVTKGDILVEITEEYNNEIIEMIEEETGKDFNSLPADTRNELFRKKTDNMTVQVVFR